MNKRTREPRFNPDRIHGLLDVLAVPPVGMFSPRRRGASAVKRGERKGGFWIRNAPLLQEMLHEIYLCYQRTLRRVHPWGGGCREAYMAVTSAWGKIKQLFAQRGITL